VLNNDQFLWQISIADINETDTGHSHWNAQTDFARNTVRKLSSWEQLAHVLLCTNEFMFVD
jgi:hypothetical protein